jgi:hypothetical protein
MAISFDASTAGTQTTGTSLTFSHTCSGVNRILFVSVVGTSGKTTTVTYNGVSMTEVGNITTTRPIRLYYLINPATGAHDVVISASGNDYLAGSSVSYKGANQLSQPDSYTTDDSSVAVASRSITTTTVKDNCWLVGITYKSSGGEGMTAGTDTYLRTSGDGFNDMSVWDSNGARTPAGSQSLNINVSPSGRVGTVMASFSPSTINTQTFTADGTWTAPTGTISQIDIFAWGGGGAGGGNGTNGAGGGAGGYVKSSITSSFPSSGTIYIGIGGQSDVGGGGYKSGGNGTIGGGGGGSSAFVPNAGTTIIAAGGGGGGGNGASVGVGGGAATGTSGGAGGTGNNGNWGGGGGGANTNGSNWAGGSGAGGTGATSVTASGGAGGNSSSTSGSGGGGSAGGASGNGNAGSAASGSTGGAGGNGSGGASGGSAGNAGTDGSGQDSGGGGGGGSSSGQGGAAGKPGAGGGGGGNPSTDGGDGKIIVITYYDTAAAGPTNVKTWNGLALASVKTINGLAIASVKSINQLA